MKSLFVISLAAIVLCAMSFAQEGGMKPAPDTTKSVKAISITGKISDDGKSFVSDSDGKSWTISNPEAVKGHEGHHVVLKAHPDADKGEVHVISLKMAKDTMSKDNMKDNKY